MNQCQRRQLTHTHLCVLWLSSHPPLSIITLLLGDQINPDGPGSWNSQPRSLGASPPPANDSTAAQTQLLSELLLRVVGRVLLKVEGSVLKVLELLLLPLRQKWSAC